ncbi:hypothetical protein, partial [Bittarella massiliensis (ex Durand et al. 2017)]
YSYSAGFGYLGGPQEGKGRGKSELQIHEIHRQANILGFAILLSIFLSNASFFLLTRLFALLSSGGESPQRSAARSLARCRRCTPACPPFHRPCVKRPALFG